MCNATTIERLGEEAAGCWLDGSRGQYIGEGVQSYAASYGWTGESLDCEHEHYHDAWDEAEAYLNDIAADGYYFGSNESGDWGLWPIVDPDYVTDYRRR